MLLWLQGEAQSQDMAQRLIMAGEGFALVNGREERIAKPGDMFPGTTQLIVRGRSPYVSRGAYKLLTALQYFSLDVRGFVAMDAGASTGGFTDCLLQHGAVKVYAVDVGKNQLHEKLQADERVICVDSVNLRLAESSLLPEFVDLVTADLSFISLTKVLPVLVRFLKPGGKILALVKPQFELAPSRAIRGVVRDPAARQEAVDGVCAFAKTLNLHFHGVTPSSIKGPKGNQEYICYWSLGTVV